MKKLSKVLSVFLSLVMLFVVGAGCGKTGGTKGVLSIAYFEGGYGATWGQKLVDAYKVHNPNAKIEVNCDPLVRDDAVTALQTNSSAVDLFFIDGVNMGMYCETYNSLADISALYTSKPKAGDTEENILIKDKISAEILGDMKYSGNREQFKDKYYLVPTMSGPCSIILNVSALDYVFGAGNWSAPNTTDELMALCDAIVSANKQISIMGTNYKVYPFIYGGSAVEYWRYMYYPWIAQYGGEKVWNDLQTVTTNGEYDKDAYQPEAKAVAYTQLEQIIKRTNGYCDISSMGNKFTTSQKYFFQKRACMLVCGDWLEREMEDKTEYDSEFMMIKTPVISDLAQKIEQEFSVSLGSTDAEKDAKLSQIITAIDNGETSLAGVKEEVFKRVKTARSYVYTLANSQIGFVPACSVNVDLAIEFLRFMYSDEGLQIILDETKSYVPTINANDFTPSKPVSSFRTSVNAIAQNSVYMYSSNRDPIRYRAGLDVFLGNEGPEVAMGKKSGYITAEQFLLSERNLLNEQWNTLMSSVL